MLQELGIRFLSVDRPGHGYSDFSDDRTLLDFAEDVDALTRHLEIDKFYVEGWSAGGAYALAVAFALGPNRVIRGATLSGIGPPDRPKPYKGIGTVIKLWMFLSRRKSRMVYPFRRMMHKAIASKSSAEVGALLTPPGSTAQDEMAVADSPEAQLVMGANIKEGYRQGWKGAVVDDYVVNGPWGFSLSDVETPFDVWQGAEDKNVARLQGEYQAETLPNSQLHILEDTAHIFPLVRWEEILEQLVRK